MQINKTRYRIEIYHDAERRASPHMDYEPRSAEAYASETTTDILVASCRNELRRLVKEKYPDARYIHVHDADHIRM